MRDLGQQGVKVGVVGIKVWASHHLTVQTTGNDAHHYSSIRMLAPMLEVVKLEYEKVCERSRLSDTTIPKCIHLQQLSAVKRTVQYKTDRPLCDSLELGRHSQGRLAPCASGSPHPHQEKDAVAQEATDRY